MHKLLWVFLILLVLSACHSPRVRRQGDESFIGMDEEELVTTIGPPDSSYEMGRERFLQTRQLWIWDIIIMAAIFPCRVK